MSKKYLILADLHLGSPLFDGDFDLYNLFNDRYDKVFVVGDLFDVWEDSLPNIIYDKYFLINKLKTLNNLYIIKGNHDPSLSDLSNIFPNAEIVDELEFEDMFFIHGHQYDALIIKYSFFAKVLNVLHVVFERLGLNLKAWFRELFHSIAVKRSKSYYNSLVLSIEKQVVNDNKYKNKPIIIGHTHLPKIVNGEDFTYINVGDWIHNKTYVIYEDGCFNLYCGGRSNASK